MPNVYQIPFKFHVGLTGRFLSLVILAINCVSVYAQTDQSSEKLTIVVIPVCLKEAGDVRNRLCIGVAEFLTERLRNTEALHIVPQVDVAEAMTKAKLKYYDTGDLKEVVKVLPDHDLFILVGPLRNAGWFAYSVCRRSDFKGQGGAILFEETKALREKGFAEYLYANVDVGCSRPICKSIIEYINSEIDESYKGRSHVNEPMDQENNLTGSIAISAVMGISSILLNMAENVPEKNYREATECLEKAVKEKPIAHLRYWLALSLLRGGEQEKAKEMASEILKHPINDELKKLVLQIRDVK